jgi:phenylacetate-coenzyme A ligase PaaK-like adenylate-forming protein
MLPPYDPWVTATVAFDVALAARARPAAIEARVRQRLGALLEAARRRSPLMRKALAGHDPATVRLDALPVTTKRDLMARFDEWVGDPEVEHDALARFMADPKRVAEPYIGRYIAWESSGSSGEPAMFLQDAAAMAVYDALEGLRRPVWGHAGRLLDPWGLADRTVFVGAIDGHFASNVSLERLRRLNPLLRERVHAISFLQPLESLCRALETRNPTVLATYPTQAVLLAEERVAGRLKISPREVWTGGETLTPAMRGVVQDAFGCKVVNTYGSSECFTIASDCPQGRLHLNADWVILESLDDEGRPAAPGTAGRTTLLTNLANHVQPIVRYDLGDRVTLHATRCACGSQLPTIDVQGRCEEVLRVPAGRGRTLSVLPLAVGTVLEEEAGLYDFQLRQRTPACLELRSGLRGAAAERDLRRARGALGAFLARQGAHGVQVECHPGEPLTVGRSGKIPRIVVDPAGEPPSGR